MTFVFQRANFAIICQTLICIEISGGHFRRAKSNGSRARTLTICSSQVGAFHELLNAFSECSMVIRRNEQGCSIPILTETLDISQDQGTAGERSLQNRQTERFVFS